MAQLNPVRWEYYQGKSICGSCASKIRYRKNKARILKKNRQYKKKHMSEINEYQRKYMKKQRNIVRLYKELILTNRQLPVKISRK